MNRVPLLIALLCLLGISTGYAQSKNDDPFSKISSSDFSKPASPAVDSNSNAVVLADMGSISFKGNSKGWFSYIFKRKTRILMLNKKGFDLATIKLSLYKLDDEREALSDLAGVTYNLDNGKIVETKLSKSDVFSERVDRNTEMQKFTLPGVKEGSIVEYSYTITSDFVFNLPAWTFQRTDCPTLWSEYQVVIPSLLNYMTIRHGVHDYAIDKGSEGHEVYSVKQHQDDGGYAGLPERELAVSAVTVKHRWAMKDLPALYPESFLTTPSNYVDEIGFQLHQTYNGETTRDVMPTWSAAADKMLKNPDFGQFMTEEAENADWMNGPLSEITSSQASPLQQARDIYYFIATNFDCKSYYHKYISTNLKDVYKKRSGNVGEINLLLTAFLRKRNIDAAPVVLSTREYGRNLPEYPVMDRLNYVICKMTIDNRAYYLDASYRHLGFGFLPGNCYNGYARVISPTDSSSIYFLADSLREQKITLVNIVNGDEGKHKLQGSCQITPGYIESYELRERVAKQGEKPYFTEMETIARGELVLTKYGIDSIKLKEEPVKIWTDFDIKQTEENADILYFTPVMWGSYKSNPFAAATRKYPIEMKYPINEMYILNMQIPEGFAVDEMPQSLRALYNGGEGEFSYFIQKSESAIQLRCTIKMKAANFSASDYASLRDFFALIVKKQQEQIVFKKKTAPTSTR